MESCANALFRLNIAHIENASNKTDFFLLVTLLSLSVTCFMDLTPLLLTGGTDPFGTRMLENKLENPCWMSQKTSASLIGYGQHTYMPIKSLQL